MNKTSASRVSLPQETTPVGGQQIPTTMSSQELLLRMPSTPAGSQAKTLPNMYRVNEDEGRSATMTTAKTFEKLMEPGYIGSLRLKNRIIKTAAGTGYAFRREPDRSAGGVLLQRSQKAESDLSLQRAAA